LIWLNKGLQLSVFIAAFLPILFLALSDRKKCGKYELSAVGASTYFDGNMDGQKNETRRIKPGEYGLLLHRIY